MKRSIFIKCDNCGQFRMFNSLDYKNINHFCSRKCNGEYSHKVLTGQVQDKKLHEICKRVLKEEYGIDLEMTTH